MYCLGFHEALCLVFAVEKFTEHRLPQSGTPFLPSSVPELELSPSQRLVLETFPCNQLSELSSRPLEDLFRFCNDAIDTYQPNVMVDLSLDQMFFDKPSCYEHEANHSTGLNLEWPPSTTTIDIDSRTNFGATYVLHRPKCDQHSRLETEFSLSANAI